jgi:hypothetical protein
MFPVSIRGSIRLKGGADGDALAEMATSRIVEMLENARASEVWVEGNEIRFAAGVFRRVWNWNILGPLGSGTIRVLPKGGSARVSYALSTLQLLGLVTGMLAIAGLVMFSTAPHSASQARSILTILAFGWACLFGANYLIAMIRFPLWLKFGLRRAQRELHPRRNFNTQ